METILGLILIYAIWYAVAYGMNAGSRAAKAGLDTARGRGSLADNLQLQFKGLQHFECRVVDDRSGENNDGPPIKALEVRGLFPVNQPVNLGFIISILDETEDDWAPVLCFLDSFQEHDTIAFQMREPIGQVLPDQGYRSWVRLGGCIPETLQAAHSGRRKLAFVLRLVDANNPPPVHLGFGERHPGLIWMKLVKWEYDLPIRGYIESREERERAILLTSRLAMAVAMADGELHAHEGEMLRTWASKHLSTMGGERAEEMKARVNDAMRDAHAEALADRLSITDLCSQLKQVNDESMKYEAVELVHEIMAADGEADPAELRVIKGISSALELDLDQIQVMRDRSMLRISSDPATADDVGALLGIDPEWSAEQTRGHLRAEFSKWNNRLNALPDGPERESAQQMIDHIAAARQRYG